MFLVKLKIVEVAKNKICIQELINHHGDLHTASQQ